MRDMLVFISDQHDGRKAGFAGDPIVRTPNLDRIASEGTMVDNAYTSCPLCIPARMSLLSGQLPSKTMVMDNAGSIPSDQATFLHSLGAMGYETVLCGRMHFEGPDQRHGFSKRIFGDITHLTHGGGKSAWKERGRYAVTLTEPGCLQIVGGGNSPVLEYDRGVIRAALDYLAQDHEKPQFIVVGTYAPHFPYVAPPELYEYYLEKVKIPLSLHGCDYDHSALALKMRDKDEAMVRAVRAAYYGMIEFTDREIGMVYESWKSYLSRTGREGVFLYLSDHGDSAGERGFYGKKIFYESSVRIPMVFAGSGIPAGKRLSGPASIMDIGPTLCELAGTQPPPEQDGQSLWGQITGENGENSRYVISEFVENTPKGKTPARMIRQGNWKYITYVGYEDEDLLFNLKSDPEELHNMAKKEQEVLRQLSEIVNNGWRPHELLERYTLREQHMKLLRAWAHHQQPDDNERWITTEAAKAYPEHYLTSKVPMPPWFRKLAEGME